MLTEVEQAWCRDVSVPSMLVDPWSYQEEYARGDVRIVGSTFAGPSLTRLPGDEAVAGGGLVEKS